MDDDAPLDHAGLREPLGEPREHRARDPEVSSLGCLVARRAVIERAAGVGPDYRSGLSRRRGVSRAGVLSSAHELAVPMQKAGPEPWRLDPTTTATPGRHVASCRRGGSGRAAGPGNAKNPGPSFKDLGSNVQSLVPLPGFEPGFPP